MRKEQERLLASLQAAGIPKEILDAFTIVKREEFVPDQVKSYAYDDIALPLDDGSTAPQPSTIAFMLKLLDVKEKQKVLEIGSGSGYVLAVVSKIMGDSGNIFGLEINTRLAVKSKNNLEPFKNIEILNRSGLQGLPEHMPYDRILVSASCQDRRVAYRLVEQLADPGILVIPIQQTIFKITKENKIVKEELYPGFSFVPFIQEG